MGGADVRSIQALEDLRAQLVRFGDETEAVLHALEMELRCTQEYLGERRRHWETKVQAAEEEYRRALRALRFAGRAVIPTPKTAAPIFLPARKR